MKTARRDGGGFSLTEVLIAAVILSICSIPLIGMFIQSKRGITGADKKREHRFYVKTIFTHLNRTSLHHLWNYYGPAGHDVPFTIENNQASDIAQSGRLRGDLAETDPLGRLVPGPAGKVNPLGFTDEFLQDIRRAGYRGQIEFDFFPRKSLGVTPDDNAGPAGILHMQAGYARVTLIDLKKERNKEDDAIVLTQTNVIMCPAIVGRPGLKLSSCPAINNTIKKFYKPILQQVEG